MAKEHPDQSTKAPRSALGLTQGRFAAKFGVTVSTVNRWENSKGSPSPLAQQRIDYL